MNRIVIAVICIALFSNAFAQQPAHELSVSGGFGLSTLPYSVDGGSRKAGFGGTVAAGYACMLSPQWGISSGIEIVFYKTQSSMDVLTGEQSVSGANGDFVFRTSYAGYRETQTAAFLQIPVMALYKHQTRTSTVFYGMAGFKFGIPVNARYSGSGNLSTSGYYEYENQEYTNMPDRGFGQFDGAGGNAKLSMGMSLSLSAEGGIEFPLSETLSLRAGLYADYGLTDTRKGDGNRQLAQYQSDATAGLAYNSLFDTRYADKVKTLAVGIKLCLTMRL